MRRISTYLLGAALLVSCSTTGSGGGRATRAASMSARGALTVEVAPNPIIANRVSGDTYDFPFEAVVRETAGAAVTVRRVSVQVVAFGGIPVYSESYGPEEIIRLGFPSVVPASGELRYRFNPRKEVADDRLFSAVSAELKVEGVDGTGARTEARTSVTVRR
ncbi:MAG TPA: hypothetical protein VNM92_13225 [Thermoanaerobaculia bacterium]|nr:hypothetical protein [Thermoanaerobaculia bacterium]